MPQTIQLVRHTLRTAGLRLREQDVEAMSSHRPYRPGLGLDAALAEIRPEAGTKLDVQVVDACERVFREQGFAFAKA